MSVFPVHSLDTTRRLLTLSPGPSLKLGLLVNRACLLILTQFDFDLPPPYPAFSIAALSRVLFNKCLVAILTRCQLSTRICVILVRWYVSYDLKVVGSKGVIS
jgi:hypothetical protein